MFLWIVIEMKPRVYHKSSENMEEVEDSSVHLIVTSPPYNVGIEYDGYDDNIHFDEYISIIKRVLDECYRVLVDGGKIAINVANLGRKPYVPLCSLYTALLLKSGFYLRGQIIWRKWSNATTTAWGSYKSPSHPVLRDVHEYIIIASKGDGGMQPPYSDAMPTITGDEWLLYTNSIWDILPYNNDIHPAIFPIEIPKRLIKLYTWQNCVVLDPFAGSGTVMQAAKDLSRDSIAYEISSKYVNIIQNIADQSSLDDFWEDHFSSISNIH